MYGLLLEGIYDYIVKVYGEKAWDEIRSRAGVHQHSFSTHTTYTEMMIPRLCKAAQLYLQVPEDEIMENLGVAFVSFVSKFGYDSMLKVQGRGLGDFLEGMDNLHEYLRLTYPKMKSPSFQIAEESSEGLTLHYRSQRKGFLYYVKGQLKQVAKLFYNTDVEIEIKKAQMDKNGTLVVMRLHFDNKRYGKNKAAEVEHMEDRPMNPDVFFHAFPFHVIFDRNMVIRHTGKSLNNIMPRLAGQRIDSIFNIRRPAIDFNFKTVNSHLNVAFELVSINTVARQPGEGSTTSDDDHMSTGKNLWKEPKSWFGMGSQSSQNTMASEEEQSEMQNKLRLKGQMKYISSWESVVFLATPIIENLDRMFELGVYITDLSMHDVSRDLILVGTQQSNELTSALEQVQVKSKKMEDAFKRVEEAMARTDGLLSQMMPKSVTERLRGENAGEDICDTFEEVTILFSDIIGFTDITGLISPMDVMSLLNSMFTKLDNLIEKHQVYKVETIADAYMVAGGAPDPNPFHALHMSELALDMRESVTDIIDPSTNEHIKIRIGLHCGPVVAGVVGRKMPRYCFFGDAVNTASRMESNSLGMKIHISESIKKHLDGRGYQMEPRGTVQIKGKGEMHTFWLEGRSGEPPPRMGAAESGQLRPPRGVAPPVAQPINQSNPPKPVTPPRQATPPPPRRAPTPEPAKPAPVQKPAPAPAPAPVRAPAPAPAPAPVQNNHVVEKAVINNVNHVANNVAQTITAPATPVGNNHAHITRTKTLDDGHVMNSIAAQDRAVMKMHRSRLCQIL